MSDLKTISIIGAGPAGLAAAEVLATADYNVSIYDAMPSFGRKFLMAGKSGLNITHVEEPSFFLDRYGDDGRVKSTVKEFSSTDIQNWMQGLGIEPKIGPTGRIFPSMMKSSPLLRAWLTRLDSLGVKFHRKHTWTGWESNDDLTFQTPHGPIAIQSDATILALGGASWKRLGSNGKWVTHLEEKGVDLSPFQPSNSGFIIEWSDRMKREFAGHPIKASELRAADQTTRSEFVITSRGIESGGVYTLSAEIMRELDSKQTALLTLDLMPDTSRDELFERLSRPIGKNSLSNHIRKATGLKGAKLALIYETQNKDSLKNIDKLAGRIKCLPLRVTAPAPMDEAISTSGGVTWNALDENLMLKSVPGVFCAGEMIDWDAPTGGYLITACMATGRATAKGVMNHFKAMQ